MIVQISKDPREELRMLGSNSSFIGQSSEEFIITLHKSTHTRPFNSRHVKMNEFKSKTIQYCIYRFGEKCRYEHKTNPDYRKKEVENDEKKKSNYIIQSKNNNKFQYKKKNSTQQNTNNNNSQNRNDDIEGKPPKYSNERQIPIIIIMIIILLSRNFFLILKFIIIFIWNNIIRFLLLIIFYFFLFIIGVNFVLISALLPKTTFSLLKMVIILYSFRFEFIHFYMSGIEWPSMRRFV